MVEDGKGHGGRVAILAMRGHVPRLGLRLHALEDRPDRHTGPAIAEPAPARDAVDVGDDVDRWERADLAVVELERILDRPEDVEIPARDVRLGHRPKVQKRPAIRGRESLPGWDARGVDALRQSLALEEGRHQKAEYRSAGILGFRRVAQPLWARSSAGRARESHSRGQGFESPRVHTYNQIRKRVSQTASPLS